MYILIAILAFGILIAVHELGHFLAAKACGVKVNEFAIGMGPAILKKQGKETLYALRVLPIGGFCAMEGEDEDTGDERAFTRQPAWKKAIILAAGATMNFVLGFLIVMILFAGAEGFYTREVTYVDRASNAASQGLMAGDEIVKLDGHRIWLRSDVSLFLERLKSPNVDVTVKRNGEKVDLHLTMTPVTDPETGKERLMLGIQLGGVEKATLGAKLRYGWYQTMF